MIPFRINRVVWVPYLSLSSPAMAHTRQTLRVDRTHVSRKKFRQASDLDGTCGSATEYRHEKSRMQKNIDTQNNDTTDGACPSELKALVCIKITRAMKYVNRYFQAGLCDISSAHRYHPKIDTPLLDGRPCLGKSLVAPRSSITMRIAYWHLYFFVGVGGWRQRHSFKAQLLYFKQLSTAAPRCPPSMRLPSVFRRSLKMWLLLQSVR